MPLLLLTHHVIPWVFKKAAEFISSQLEQFQSPDPTEGLESQTEIQQDAPERHTSATEGNVSGSQFMIPDDLKIPLEVRKYQPDPVPSPQAAAGPSPQVAAGPSPQAATGPRHQDVTGPKPQVAAGPSPQPVLAATLEKNHSVKKDPVMEGQKEVQKPAKSWKVAKDAGDAVTLEVCGMNSSIFPSSDFPPLQREMFDNRNQKTDVSPWPKMGRISKKKSVRRIIFGSHFMIPDNLKMPIEVRNYFPDPLPRPRAAARPKRQSVLATETQPSTSSLADAAAGPKPQAGAGPIP